MRRKHWETFKSNRKTGDLVRKPGSQAPTPVPPCTCGLPVKAQQRPGRGTLLGARALPKSWAVGWPRTLVSALVPASLRAASSDPLGAAAPGGTARLSGLTAALSPALRRRPAQPGALPGAVHHTPTRPRQGAELWTLLRGACKGSAPAHQAEEAWPPLSSPPSGGQAPPGQSLGPPQVP